jgi:hypothetical protein
VQHVSMVISTNKSGFSLYLLILVTQSGMRYRFSGPATKTTFRHSDLSGSSFVQIEVYAMDQSLRFQKRAADYDAGYNHRVDRYLRFSLSSKSCITGRKIFFPAGSQSVSVYKELEGV